MLAEVSMTVSKYMGKKYTGANETMDAWYISSQQNKAQTDENDSTIKLLIPTSIGILIRSKAGARIGAGATRISTIRNNRNVKVAKSKDKMTFGVRKGRSSLYLKLRKERKEPICTNIHKSKCPYMLIDLPTTIAEWRHRNQFSSAFLSQICSVPVNK